MYSSQPADANAADEIHVHTGEADWRARRFWMLGLGMTGLGASVFMFLNAMGDSMMFYLTPTQVHKQVTFHGTLVVVA